MFKYQVKFQTRRQIDGWTDPSNDLEYDTVSETVTVVAKNQKAAICVARKRCKTRKDKQVGLLLVFKGSKK
ncbi:MAG: hypothetical protein ACREBR_04880 [bacterium]